MTDVGDEIDDVLNSVENKAATKSQNEGKKVAEKKTEAVKRRKIMIQEGAEEENYVFVSVNGRAYQIMRGKEVEVPEHVLEVLDNAKMVRLVKVGVDEKGHDKMVPREYQRFPYSIVA